MREDSVRGDIGEGREDGWEGVACDGGDEGSREEVAGDGCMGVELCRGHKHNTDLQTFTYPHPHTFTPSHIHTLTNTGPTCTSCQVACAVVVACCHGNASCTASFGDNTDSVRGEGESGDVGDECV